MEIRRFRGSQKMEDDLFPRNKGKKCKLKNSTHFFHFFFTLFNVDIIFLNLSRTIVHFCILLLLNQRSVILLV